MKNLAIWLATGLLYRVLLGRNKPDSARMRRLEFSTSTRRLGIVLTDALRDALRRRWLKYRP